MGMDAKIVVALKKGANVSEINQRFRDTHCKGHTCVEGMDLILDFAAYEWGEVEHLNAYHVSTGLSRYYEDGYERGPCLELMLQLEWLRSQPEVDAVYYYSDAHESPRVWSESDSIDLVKHFFKNGHTPYAEWAKSTWKLK